MARRIINIGSSPNAKDGDIIRDAFNKTNQNFEELYALTGETVSALTELAQDYAAEMFVNATHSGVTLTYDDENNKLSISTNFDGNYNNLSNKPSIPSDVSDLTDTTGLLNTNTGDFTFTAGDASLPPGSTMTLSTYQSGGNKESKLTLSTGGLSSLDVGNNLRVRIGNGTGFEKDWTFGADGSLRFPDNTVQTTAYTGGGTANTGDVTFSGVKVIGAGTASGDGLGYSTLELVPDGTLVSDQYIIVDPTAPNHIHLRAGGTQDASTAELYLGGERNHVRIRDGIGVSLQNDVFTINFYGFQQGVDYDTATWSTDEFGNTWLDITITDPQNPTRSSTPFDVPFFSFTQFPQNRIEVFDGTTYTDLIGNGQAYTLGNQYQLRIGITQAPTTNPTSISTLTFRINTLTQNSLLLENNGFDLSVDNSAYVYANQSIQLTTGTGDLRIITDDNNTSRSWYFTARGYLQFPQGVSPTTSKGQAGDQAGSVVFDGSYIYYCTATYTDGIADIWKRVAWSGDTW